MQPPSPASTAKLLPLAPSGLAAIKATYGDPLPFVEDKAAWESKILVTRTLPAHLLYAYDPRVEIHRIRAHTLVADALVDALMACFEAGVPRHRLKYGGCYAWRAMRGGAKLSTHTWGIAVDLEPAENRLGVPYIRGKMLDKRVVDIFKDRGWTWGGDFNRPDCMHFQAAQGY